MNLVRKRLNRVQGHGHNRARNPLHQALHAGTPRKTYIEVKGNLNYGGLLWTVSFLLERFFNNKLITKCRTPSS